MLTDVETKQRIAANVTRYMAAMNPPMSQTELAHVTGEGDMRISLMVRGVKMPGAGFLARIAEALGVTVTDLLAPARKLPSRT